MMKFLFVLLFLPLSYASAQKATSVRQYDTVYTRPNVLASFPGGDAAWKKYVKKKMNYPRKAWWDEVESDVQIKLIIEKDGTVSEAHHLNISNYGFEQEAVRLVLKSGKWKPALHRGKPVKSEGLLTINFRLR
jgi:protein TonB